MKGFKEMTEAINKLIAEFQDDSRKVVYHNEMFKEDGQKVPDWDIAVCDVEGLTPTAREWIKRQAALIVCAENGFETIHY